MPSPTLIIFSGLPATGKTTIARELLSIVREERAGVGFTRDYMGVDLPFWRRSLQRLVLILSQGIRTPLKMVLASQRLTPSDAYGKDALKTRWNFWSVLAIQSRAQDDLLIADEGLAQAIWTARIHHGPDAVPNGIFRKLDGWIGDTLFVHVVAPPPVARERLAKRIAHTSRFQNAGLIDDVALWARGEEAVERIAREINAELLRRNLPGRLLRIARDREDTPLDRAKLIRNHFYEIDAAPTTVRNETVQPRASSFTPEVLPVQSPYELAETIQP